MTDEELTERLEMTWESFMRRAPCSPTRTDSEIQSAHRALTEMAEERPDQAWRVRRVLDSLRRECASEQIEYPGPD